MRYQLANTVTHQYLKHNLLYWNSSNCTAKMFQLLQHNISFVSRMRTRERSVHGDHPDHRNTAAAVHAARGMNLNCVHVVLCSTRAGNTIYYIGRIASHASDWYSPNFTPQKLRKFCFTEPLPV